MPRKQATTISPEAAKVIHDLHTDTPSEEVEEAVANSVALTPAPTAPVDLSEMKIMVGLKNGKATVGVQAKNTDPVLFTLDRGPEDTLAGTLGKVPPLVEAAVERWRQTPKNAPYKRPEPPAAPKTAGTAAAAARQKAATAPKKGPQVTQKQLF